MPNATARTELFARWTQGSLVVSDEGKSTGARFWVHSGTGTNAAGYGQSPERPFASLAYAFSSDVCTASKEDVIYVMPGHTEAIAAAAGILADIAGVRVVGLGDGNLRPSITYSTAATADFDVTAANITIENIIFDMTGVDSLNNPLHIAAAGCTIRNCEFEIADATGQADCAILTTAAADDLLIENSYFFGSGDAGATTAIDLVGGDSIKIRNNGIVGAFTTSVGGIRNATTAATNLVIEHNFIDNRTAISTKAIIAHANATGVLQNNYLSILSGTAPITAAAMVWTGNHYCAAVGAASTIMDAVSITAATLATDAVDADAIADNAIDAGAIANGAIDAATFAAGAINAAAIADGAIDAATFAAGAIDAAAIANSAIDAATFAAGAIDAAAIANSAIDAATFAAGAINAAAIADGAIDAATFAAGAIDAAAIANDAIDATAIANGAIDAATFAAGAIDAAAIANGAIDAATFAAGAIDAAAIANSAIDAATFAAGAIDATAIADGAIDAATFAAGAINAAAIANDAIDATAIATGAIDADAIADNAIDAGAIAGDAITNAKIADNAFASEQFALSAGEKTTDGIVVTKATAALPQTAAAAIFTVTGLCLVKRLIGYVTVNIGAVANATKLVGNSTGAGASTDLCGTLDINGHASDSRYEITGTFANAMVRTLDIPAALTQVTNIVIPPGTIDLNCAGSDGGTGRVRWSVTYVPMESGAQIVAA